MRVAFVVCPSYHGATLLALLLNNHSQISALGDMLPWLDVDSQACACGRYVGECEFWQDVSAHVDTSRFPPGPTLLPAMPWPLARRQMEGITVPVTRSPALNRAAGRLAGTLVDVAAPAAWRVRRQPVSDFVETYRSFYSFVLSKHGTSTFVDGNKSWRKVALLARELQLTTDVKIVHVVRDPRGFAASCRHHSGADPQESALVWAHLHKRMEALRAIAPYRLLKYEDLCERPEEQMREILRFLDVEPEEVVSAPKHPHKHHVLGNQMFRTFSGNVTLDERWRSELSPEEQRTVVVSAGPVADRLGYTADGSSPSG
jgi:Sulfotransferase domain